MSDHLLYNNITSLVPITDEEWHFISSRVTEQQLKKKVLISREGDISRFTNFIEKGSARVFYIDNNGHEHVIQLGIQGWWISDFASFSSQKPGRLYVETLEPTHLLSFSYENMQEIFKNVPSFESFYRILIQKAYSSFQQRMLQSLSGDAENRYLQFRECHPDMDLQISQKHIASYLGMSAEFLSKIKKRVLHKKK